MAKYRQLYTDFWNDGFIVDITPQEKFFYLYILTNCKTSQCGIYELPKRTAEKETGYSMETIDILLKKFCEYKKILYCDDTKEVMVINWIKYNVPNNTNAIKCVNKELGKVKNKEFIKILYKQCKSENLDVHGIFQGIDVEDVSLEEQVLKFQEDFTKLQENIPKFQEKFLKIQKNIQEVFLKDGQIDIKSKDDFLESKNELLKPQEESRKQEEQYMQNYEAETFNNNGYDTVQESNKDIFEPIEGAYKGLPSNRIINNKEKVINNNQKIISSSVLKNDTCYDDMLHTIVSKSANSDDEEDDEAFNNAIAEIFELTKVKDYEKNSEIAVAKESVEFSSVVQAFENNINPMTPMQREKLIDWSKDVPNEVIIMAIEAAVNYNARNMSYINKTLNAWTSKGIKTVEGVKNEQRKWEDKKKKSDNGNTKKSTFCDYEQRDYDFVELERKLLGA